MSRDPRRITRTLALIEHYWRRYPDLRLGQIVGNAGGQSAYYMEDEALMEQLEAWLAEDVA